jgi:N-acetylglucosaminyl-diphospho-decaprenol L-rhamnosyltransferase
LEGLLLAVAAVIVTHNSASYIGRSLDALAEMAPSVQTVVVDNASQDATLERVREHKSARLITNPKNRGFAAAANQGVQAVDAEFYLLLNPDVFLRTNIDPLVEAAKQHGIAAGLLMDKTGTEQRGFTIRRFPTPLTLWFELAGLNRLWPSNPVNRRYRYWDRDVETEGPVEQPAGAFLMLRKDVWERLGGLDEGFHPIWFEDVDLCKRAAYAGTKPWLVPKVAAEHEGGHSISRLKAGCRQVYWCASLLKYAAKHFPPLTYRGICLAVLLTSVPRAVAGMIREQSLSPILSCINIVGFAGRQLVSGRLIQASPGRSL